MKSYKMRDFSTAIGDLSGFSAGYTMSDPNTDPILSGLTSLLQVIPSQPVVDEIAKMLAGLVVSIISRAAFSWLDKWNTRRKNRKNKNNNGNEESNQKESDSQESDKTQGN